MTTNRNPHDAGRAPFVSILRLEGVCSRVGIGKAEVYRRINAGTFPRSVRLGTRAVGWVESEVDAYLRALIAERDAKEAA